MGVSLVGFYVYAGCSPIEVSLPPGFYQFEAWGAEGGRNTGWQAFGGKGGYAKGELAVRSRTTFFIHLGERGKDNTAGVLTAPSCNGGGSGYYYCGGGGGSSDIRAQVDDIYHRILVAGGGGGGNDRNGENGGFGGGSIGGDGLPKSSGAYSGKGGNQNTETTTCENGVDSISNCPYGTFGFGGSATGNKGYQSGGGGGWFGGSGSYESGAGGGSGYVLTKSSFKPNGYFSEYSRFEFRRILNLGGNETIPQASSSLLSIATEPGHSGHGNFKIIFLYKPHLGTYISQTRIPFFLSSYLLSTFIASY